MIFHSGSGILSDCNLKRAGGIDHAVHIVARLDRLHGGEARHTSIVTPAMIRFLRPVFSIAATNFGSSHALMIPGRSITGTSGNMLTTSGINGPFGP